MNTPEQVTNATIWYQAGFTDIIPVIPPNAVLLPESRVDPDQRGKVPGQFYNGGWDGIGSWPTMEADQMLVTRWDQIGANVGLKMGWRWVSLDLDIRDPQTVQALRNWLAGDRVAANAPIRVGQAPKFLLLFRVIDGEVIRKRSHQIQRDDFPKGEKPNQVEVLGVTKKGRPSQAVVAGMHPTGAQYQWDRPVVADQVPLINVEYMDYLVEQCLRVCEQHGWTRGRTKQLTDLNGTVSPLAQNRTPVDLVRDLVNVMPNDDLEYDDWIAIALAIKWEVGAEAGREIFIEWSAKAPKNKPKTTAHEWDTLSEPEGGANFGKLRYWADEQGADISAELMQRLDGEMIRKRNQIHLSAAGVAQLPAGAQPLQTQTLPPKVQRLSDNFFIAAAQLVPGEVGPQVLPMIRYTARGGIAQTQVASPSNVTHILSMVGAKKLFNMMTQDVEWTFEGGPLAEHVATASEAVAVPILKEIAAWCWISPTNMENALADVQAEQYHLMEDWLDALPPWDGVDRLSTIADQIPSPNPVPYRRAVITRWFIQGVQAVKGWRGEEKQIPHVLTFAGEQGSGKTQWSLSCAPRCFTAEGVTLDLSGDHNKDRDSIRAATGKPIAELGELEGTFGKSGIEALKNFLSKTSNIYRMPYDRREITVRRCTVFIGTVNSMGFLRDDTGSRRFWPIEITGELQPVDNVDQVWAQALHYWRHGASWFLTDAEKALHADVVEYHSEGSNVDDLMSVTFPLGFYKRDDGEHVDEKEPLYEVFNITEVMKRAQINPTKENRRLVRGYIEKHNGRIGRWGPHPSLGVGKRRDGTVMALKDVHAPTLPPGVVPPTGV